MARVSGSHCARVAGERPWVLRISWQANRAPASPRNRLMRALHAGRSPSAVRNLANIDPDLAPPGGDSWKSRSVQGNDRCTFIKLALVSTMVGGKKASTVCLSLLEAWPWGLKK